jgi:hypothetical protein
MEGRRLSGIISLKTEHWQHVDLPKSSYVNLTHVTPLVQQSRGWLGNDSDPYDGFSGNAKNQALFPPFNTSNGSMPTSFHKDWMSESLESRGMPKRMRPRSPGLRSHSPLLRRDGIRKKNTSFDIPAERNLLNIDQLIAQSTDEQEIKELKQQKRLLRNRQAAYATLTLVSSPLWLVRPTNLFPDLIHGSARSNTLNGLRMRRSDTQLFSTNLKNSLRMPKFSPMN